MLTYDQARPGAVLRAKQLRRNSTEVERKLLRALRSKLPGFNWRPPLPIGPYFADIACFAERLLIELDGGQHAGTAGYDQSRTRFLEARGYRVLRFWNNEVTENLDGVLERIAATLSSPSRSCAAPSLSQGRGINVEPAR
jgi:very-short-patch-repair endonuclease